MPRQKSPMDVLQDTSRSLAQQSTTASQFLRRMIELNPLDFENIDAMGYLHTTWCSDPNAEGPPILSAGGIKRLIGFGKKSSDLMVNILLTDQPFKRTIIPPGAQRQRLLYLGNPEHIPYFVDVDKDRKTKDDTPVVLDLDWADKVISWAESGLLVPVTAAKGLTSPEIEGPSIDDARNKPIPPVQL